MILLKVKLTLSIVFVLFYLNNSINTQTKKKNVLGIYTIKYTYFYIPSFISRISCSSPCWNQPPLPALRTWETQLIALHLSHLKSTPTVSVFSQRIFCLYFRRISLGEKICFQFSHLIFKAWNTLFWIECCWILFFPRFWKILAFGRHIKHVSQFESLLWRKNILERFWWNFRVRLKFQLIEVVFIGHGGTFWGGGPKQLSCFYFRVRYHVFLCYPFEHITS